MSNLLPIKLKVKESFPQYECAIVDPISYVKTLSDLNEKHLFVYLPKKPTNSPTTNVHAQRINTTFDLTDDLIGNPLEDDCEFEGIEDLSMNSKVLDYHSWTEAEETYSFLDFDKANQILNDLTMDPKFTESQTSGSVWIICQRPVPLPDNKGPLLLEVEFNSEWNKRGIVMFQGHTKYAAINVEAIIAKHKETTNKIDVQIDAWFNIQPNMILKLSWENSPFVSSMSLRKANNVMLYQTIHTKHISSAAEEFWHQIYLLDSIKDDILKYKTYGEDKKKLVYSCGGTLQLQVIKQEIDKILDEVVKTPIEDSNEHSGIESIILRTQKRTNPDVTQQLWTILRLCSTYSDLKDSFNFIFQCAAKRSIVNLPTNDNHLAKLICGIAQQRLAVPCLTGTEPLELLLEIGLEKLSKDYEFIYTESRICSAKDLNLSNEVLNKTATTSNEPNLNVRKTLYNAAVSTQAIPSNNRNTLIERNPQTTSPTGPIGFQNSHFNEHDVDQKLAKLAQIHLILEHLLLIQINLNLENDYGSLVNDLQKPPKPFRYVKSMSMDKREITINNDKIFSKIETQDPHALRIVMRSENNFQKLTNTHYFNVNSIFPINVFPFMQNEEKESSDKSNVYSSLQYLKRETKMV